MNLTQLKQKRAQLLREADGLKVDGAFADDQARVAFDAKMTEVDELDAQIRTLESSAAPAAPASAASTTEARELAIRVERERVTAIRTICRTHQMAQAFEDAQIDTGVDPAAVRSAILEQLEARSAATPLHQHGNVRPGEDARDKWMRGALAWLLVRSGMAAMIARHEGTTADKLDPGEFRGLSLLDLARQSLERAGQSVRGLDKMALAGQAMAYRSNYQTTSDFATLLTNTMHKVLQAAYALQNDTWSKFCGTGTVSDFRAHNFYRLGSLSQLDSLNEHGEFKSKSIPDAETSSMTATTKGNIIGVSRQVIVNDDIGAVMRLTEMLGRAGKLTIEKAVYTSLGLNSGLGPTQSDSQPLFHANRANVNATAAAITVASISADVAVMRSQMDPNSQDYLDLLPAVLLVPVAKDGDAKTINDAQFDPADNKFQKPNTVRGIFRDVVSTPRLSGTRRYLFADPTTAPVFMVSFLEGQREPVLETQDGWRTDGVEMKARLDFGVDVVDYRGAVTNAGA